MNKSYVLRNKVNARQLWAFLKGNAMAYADQGRPLEVSINEYKCKRSAEQNRYYWQMLTQIADGAYLNGKQYSRDAWHYHFRNEFPEKEEMPSGELQAISTTQLKVAEFAEYISKIEAFAATQLGVEII